MPNIATAFKEEVIRLARKELRRESALLRKAITRQRHELAQLKATLVELSRAVARARRSTVPTAAKEDRATSRQRITVKGLKSLRERLGLSADEFGMLIGVSAQSVYAWEQERSSPRAGAVAAIIELRGMGKKEVKARIAELRETAHLKSLRKARRPR